ncbi:MAG: hypothetical protein NZM37_00790 [Sandaracinaceae bacterium]|nr:hypothetical protein [Sandaracinaceae bacterium]MDW8245661.1 hypothetical protein [Sandaracinaceae bacterium]
MAFLPPPIQFLPFRGPRGEAKAQELAPGVFYCWASGHIDLGMFRYFTHSFDQVVQRTSPVESFYDWRDISGYDPEVREAHGVWTRKMRKHIARSHILFRSPQVAMALAVARLKLPYLEFYTDFDLFEERKREVLRERGIAILPKLGK